MSFTIRPRCSPISKPSPIPSYIAWRDDRFLTRASSGDSYDDKKYWTADPEIMNSEVTAIPLAGNFYVSHGPPPFTGISVDTGGAWIWGFTRLARRYYAQYDLQQFPFDMQSAEILFESYGYNQDKLVWVPSKILTQFMLPKGFSVDGWLVQSKAAVVTTNEYPALAETYARAGISIKLSRIPTYFLGKYVLNISLIVVMALCTLVFDNGSENVFCVPVACFMGIVSWMFVLAAQTPVLGYTLDSMTSWRSLTSPCSSWSCTPVCALNGHAKPDNAAITRWYPTPPATLKKLPTLPR